MLYVYIVTHAHSGSIHVCQLERCKCYSAHTWQSFHSGESSDKTLGAKSRLPGGAYKMTKIFVDTPKKTNSQTTLQPI